MEITVPFTVSGPALAANSAIYGPLLRVFSVALDAPYGNITTPQVNLTAAQPWSRANNISTVQLSAFCFYFGVHAVLANPNRPIGMIASS